MALIFVPRCAHHPRFHKAQILKWPSPLGQSKTRIFEGVHFHSAYSPNSNADRHLEIAKGFVPAAASSAQNQRKGLPVLAFRKECHRVFAIQGLLFALNSAEPIDWVCYYSPKNTT